MTIIVKEMFVRGLLVQNKNFTCAFPNPANKSNKFEEDYRTIG